MARGMQLTGQRLVPGRLKKLGLAGLLARGPAGREASCPCVGHCAPRAVLPGGDSELHTLCLGNFTVGTSQTDSERDSDLPFG